jgi:hypothetical protein
VHQARDDTHVHLVHLSKARRRFASVHEDDMDSQTMEFVNVAYDDLSSSSDIPSVLDTKRHARFPSERTTAKDDWYVCGGEARSAKREHASN